LYIPDRVIWPEPAAHGYADALEALGWDVILHRATSKLEIIQYIEQYGVELIFTGCRHGVRQLPTEVINRNRVRVVIEAKPHNHRNDAPSTAETADPLDPVIISMIEHHLLYTHYELGAWDRYFNGWFGMDLPIIHLPRAGNLVRALPSSLVPTHDIAMVGYYGDKRDAAVAWIVPLLHRLARNSSIQVWCDPLWQQMGFPMARPLINAFDKFAEIFGRASVSPNVHGEEDRRGLAVNDRTFEIPLCGGYMVTDNPLANRYLGEHARVVSSPTHLIAAVEEAVQNPFLRMSNLVSAATFVAANHSYFNRLAVIFHTMCMDEDGRSAIETGLKLAKAHARALQAKVAKVVIGEAAL
jgi:hypothetical protein